MLAMSPDVSPLGFLIHYAKDSKTLSSLSLPKASIVAGRFLSNKVFAGIRERRKEKREEGRQNDLIF